MQRLLRRGLTGVSIFAVTAVAFTFSQVHEPADSNYSLLVSDGLIRHGTFSLDHYALPRFPRTRQYDNHSADGPLYQLEYSRGHLYYFFPPGSSVLSAPIVAIFEAFGVSPVSSDGSYDRQAEKTIEGTLAPLLMAALAAVLFATARLLLPLAASVAVAFAAAFGTQIYSTASRVLWSDTWGILLQGAVVYLLVAHESGRRRVNPVVLGTLMAWSFFVRPTFAVAAVVVGVYLLTMDRRVFVQYVATGAAWLVGFVVYSWSHFHQLLPSYYRAGRLGFDHFGLGLAGNLVSPSRGVLVYVPVILLLPFVVARYRHHLAHRRLVAVAGAIVVCHIVVIAGYFPWWGGHSFGPRLTTGLVPWLTLLAIFALAAMLEARHVTRRRIWMLEAMVGAVLLAFGLFVHTLGATANASWRWNSLPTDVDTHTGRLWDWRQPQFLAAFQVAGRCYEPTDRFVSQFYRGGLRREPHPDEQSLWTERLQGAGGAERLAAAQALGSAVFASPEYARLTTSSTRFVTDLYRAYLAREPDTSSNYWQHKLAQGAKRQTVRAGFARSAEFRRDVDHLC